MPTKETATAVEPKRTTTNWKAFQDAGLVPVAIECQTYPPIHQHDYSCHTKLTFTIENLKRHLAAEHGGAYCIYLRKTDGRPAKFWDDMMESGLEAVDFRCGVCQGDRPDRNMRFHPTSLAQHMKSHRGNSKQSYAEVGRRHPKAIGLVQVTVSDTAVQQTEDLDEYETI
jgi:hypothetical protein